MNCTFHGKFRQKIKVDGLWDIETNFSFSWSEFLLLRHIDIFYNDRWIVIRTGLVLYTIFHCKDTLIECQVRAEYRLKRVMNSARGINLWYYCLSSNSSYESQIRIWGRIFFCMGRHISRVWRKSGSKCCNCNLRGIQCSW